MNPATYNSDHECYPHKMGIPPEYQHCRFDNFRSEGIKARINSIIQAAESRSWIVMLGKTTGNGKTHNAVAAMIRSWAVNTYMPEYSSVRRHRPEDWYKYYNARKLGVELENAGIKFSSKVDEIVDHTCILLDEFGRAMSDKARDRLEILIDECHSNRVQLIITAGMTPAEFNNSLDGSILRRIKDHAVMVHFDWKRQG